MPTPNHRLIKTKSAKNCSSIRLIIIIEKGSSILKEHEFGGGKAIASDRALGKGSLFISFRGKQIALGPPVKRKSGACVAAGARAEHDRINAS